MTSSSMARVAVTGMGVVCCLGRGTAAVWPRLLQGRSGFSPLTLPGFEAFEQRPAGQVPAACLHPLPAAPRPLSRHELFAWLATQEALDQARWQRDFYPPDQVVTTAGIGSAGLLEAETWFEARRGGRRISSRLLHGYPASALSDLLAQAHGWTGPRFAIATACSSSGASLGLAAGLIRRGRVRAALVVGSESLSRLTLGGFCSLRSVAPDTCRPFDRHRQGLILGEGAAALVLEDMDLARGRQAPLLAEVLGWGCSADAHHMTSPLPDGSAMARAMTQALSQAGVAPEQVGYVNLHGTGTPLNDVAETKAVQLAFGQHAQRLALSSTKSMTGHCLGAAGAIEAVFTILALVHGQVPPTANLETPDPECDLDYVAGQGRPMAGLRVAMNNVMAFAGNNVSLVFGLV